MTKRDGITAACRDCGTRDYCSVLWGAVNKLACGEPGQDLFDLAAAYACGVAADYPFNDVNKHTIWTCCALSLEINGVALAVSAESVVA